VTFRYKHELDPNGIPQFGLVAEEVEKVNPDLTKHICNFLKFSPFPVGSLVSGFSPRSAALRLLKVESDINGILPAEECVRAEGSDAGTQLHA